MQWLQNALVVFATVGTLISAHPGHDGTTEMLARAEYMATLEHTDLAACAGKLQKRGHVDMMVERRRSILRDLRRRKGLDPYAPEHTLTKRQMAAVLAKDHKSKLDFGAVASPLKADWTLLGQNKSTILSPEQTEGPYYIAGEFLRKNVKEKETGVELHLDIQVVDMATCKPIPQLAVDIWSCNATGIYSGLTGFGNGNSADKSNANNKALRGIQMSGADGAVQFETIVPGHYQGRTHHIHVLTHIDSKVNPANNTITGGRVAHVGQLYFDQSLVDAIEKLPPYASNKQPWYVISRHGLGYAKDRTMVPGAANGADPVVEYTLIGKDLKDGLFAWINFGIDASKDRRVMAAASCTADGCKAGGLFAMMGGAKGGGAKPKGGAPKGAAPKGFGPPVKGTVIDEEQNSES